MCTQAHIYIYIYTNTYKWVACLGPAHPSHHTWWDEHSSIPAILAYSLGYQGFAPSYPWISKTWGSKPWSPVNFLNTTQWPWNASDRINFSARFFHWSTRHFLTFKTWLCFFQDDFALVLLEDADEQIYLTEELQSTRKAPRVAQFREILMYSGAMGVIYKYIYMYRLYRKIIWK